MEVGAGLSQRGLILEVAAQLFMAHGYKSVSLRQIAERVGLRTPSLYAHFPGGKEQIYVEAAERALGRYGRGIESAAGSAQEIREALRAVASWILAQPPMDLARIVRTDLPFLSKASQRRLEARLANCLIRPLRSIVQAALERGELSDTYADILGPVFLVAVEGIREAERYSDLPREALVEGVIGLLLEGARFRRS